MKIIIIIFTLLLSSPLIADINDFRGAWLCIEDESIGFNWNKDSSKWESGKYKPVKLIFRTFKIASVYVK